MPPRFDILGLGLNACDHLFRLDAFPQPGEKLAWRERHLCPGGQVAVACVVAARYGLRVAYAGSVGDDDAGAWQAAGLQAEGVDLARLRRVPGCASQQAWILVDARGERTILYHRPEALAYPADAVDASWIASGRVLHLDGHDTEAAARAAELARAAGVIVSLDLSRLRGRPRAAAGRLLRHTDHLIAGASLLDGGDPESELRRWRDTWGMAVAAVTLGDRGVLALDDAGFTRVPAFPVPVTDTTGAGDVFHGGYLVGLLRGWALRPRLEFAAALAALNCTAWGARGYIAPPAEVERLLAGYRAAER